MRGQQLNENRSNRQYEALLFDMDGVLVNSFEVWWRVMNLVAEKLAKPSISRERLRTAFGQSVEDDTTTFFPGTSAEELTRLYETWFPQHVDHLAVNDNSPDLIAELTARGVAMTVVTNCPRELAAKMLARTGLASMALVAADEVARPKPHPDLLIEASRRLRVDVRRVLLVGDSASDRRAAAAAGCTFAGYGIEGDLELESLWGLMELEFVSRDA